MTPATETIITDLRALSDSSMPDLVSHALIVRAADRLGELSAWRDIATAPKDGTHFLAEWKFRGFRRIAITEWSDHSRCWYGSAAFGFDNMASSDERIQLYKPTHPLRWMPLPAPPAQT